MSSEGKNKTKKSKETNTYQNIYSESFRGAFSNTSLQLAVVENKGYKNPKLALFGCKSVEFSNKDGSKSSVCSIQINRRDIPAIIEVLKEMQEISAWKRD